MRSWAAALLSDLFINHDRQYFVVHQSAFLESRMNPTGRELELGAAPNGYNEAALFWRHRYLIIRWPGNGRRVAVEVALEFDHNALETRVWPATDVLDNYVRDGPIPSCNEAIRDKRVFFLTVSRVDRGRSQDGACIDGKKEG